MEPGVGRGQELALRFPLSPPRAQGRAGPGLEDVAVDDPGERLADVRVSGVGVGEEAALLDGEPAAGVEVVGGLVVEGARRRDEGVDAGAVSVVGDLRDGGGSQEAGMALEVPRRQHVLADVDGVPGEEPAAPGVEGMAELRAAGDGLRLERVGIESAVALADVHRLPGRVGRPAGLAVRAAVGAVDPVVRAADEAVDPELGVSLCESGEDRPPRVRPSVAVSVLEVEDVRRGGDQQPGAEGERAGGEGKSLGEDPARLVASVAVAVLEATHPPRRRAERVVGHLGDPEPPLLVPGNRHRIGDLRLAGGELDQETGRKPEALPFPGRGEALIGLAAGRGCLEREREEGEGGNETWTGDHALSVSRPGKRSELRAGDQEAPPALPLKGQLSHLRPVT